ncbi:hypothetical protein PtA15_16A374 [Puccinia triticina]|uniref:Uncharacterized protein n=1 Tax=Puccinia triticina TaxID=208348 RepID=A0ABY7D4B4_9BASI|nr:uncharacterized protein PtA15_16A374 [Puccinia triticina]WAQ92466.1 hypothetical protein PtA15_16A374 [Puccinia triticina]WAR64208.1 hypothetical protein PtB15_16B368 [Puccinia triticina]
MALEAQMSGDAAKADKILNALPGISKEEQPKKAALTVVKHMEKEKGNVEPVKENSIVLFRTKVNTFLDQGLPPFFDRNMKEIKGKQTSLHQ